ncbi:MAG: cyclase family protein, partial [Dehalococcoidia bacterium]|nr:cyclase family protein [Dehalococcoidia bacterium]
SGGGGSMDFIGMAFHGATITHVDSLAHQFWDGKMYNGKPASLVNARQRATAGGIEAIEDGVVTRGVLLDIAALKGKPWLEAGEGVFTEDLEAAEKAQGVRVEEGDALLVRMGWYKRRQQLGPIPLPAVHPGVHAAALPWLHSRGVSILAADAPEDVVPNTYPRLGLPLHKVGIIGMGLWLIDAGNFEELAQVCNRLHRWEFMFVMAPLRFPHATGSPVNPLAIF